MKRTLSALLCAALLLSLAACGGQEGAVSSQPSPSASQAQPPPEAIPFTLPMVPQSSLHPALGANRTNMALAPLLYEGLFLVDEHFQAVPVLCKSYTASPDHLTWTFTLRAGITFSDGTPLTGQQVADALGLARSPQSRYAQRLAAVSSITAQDMSVTISLSRPNGSLPLLLDIPIALGDGDRPAGTGPYVLAGREDQLALDLRAGWWQDSPRPLDSIPLRAVEGSEQLLYAFDAGDVCLVDVDLLGTSALSYGGNYQTWDYATTDMIYLGFNTQSGPCRDARVRQALSLAIDRDAMVQTVYAGHGAAAVLPVHPDSPLYAPQQAAKLAYSPDVLAGQVEELDLQDRELRLLVNSENTSKVAAAKLIAYQLESAGVAVAVEQLPFERYTAALEQGSFDLYLGQTVLTADFDLSPLLSTHGALNYSRWQDATTDLLLAFAAQADMDSAPQASADLLAHLGRQMPMAPLLFKNGCVLTQWGRVSGLRPLRGNVFYQMENWTIQ